ncbi:MAG: hypothetical protein COB37_02130 [Kordiimonadales bacterium]|nr:MAG: hypothetical protein COB37_02130 [Kordiimonadales bacterium]
MKISVLIKMVIVVIFAPLSVQANAEQTDAQRIYIRQAMLGDLENISEKVSGLVGAEGVLQKFDAKFVQNQHGIAVGQIEDSVTRAVMTVFLDYWRSAMLAPDKISALEDVLEQKLVNIVRTNIVTGQNFDPKNLLNVIATYIEGQGYGVLFGRTAPLLELMLWQKNDPHQYRVVLTDSTEAVDVVHIGGFVSRGWAYYATHGVSSTGGWATPKQLFCVCDSYDQQSEDFKVSYLKHEGRHFADYKKYPKLQSASLEYRAKLTELAFSQETLYGLLTRFTNHGVANAQGGHHLANWHVANDMKAALMLNNEGDRNPAWKDRSILEIQNAARHLLKQSDKKISDLGSKVAEHIIHPVSTEAQQSASASH